MEIERFSRLLLDLQEAADTTSIWNFREVVLRKIRRFVPFDSVMWSAHEPGVPRPANYVWMLGGVPTELAELVENPPDAQGLCNLFKEALDEPRIFAREQLEPGTWTAALTACAGSSHVMFISHWNEAQNTFSCLGFGRRDPGQGFSEDARSLIRLLMPHLQALEKRNFESRTTAAIVNRIAGEVGLAVVAHGSVLKENASFVHLMLKAWPAWTGPALPAPLIEAAQARTPLVANAAAEFHWLPCENHLLLIATPPSPLHALTSKEFVIANDFAQGKSYKEVARTHGLPPETVRSRLRTVYEKLHVDSKTALSKRLARTGLLEDLQHLF